MKQRGLRLTIALLTLALLSALPLGCANSKNDSMAGYYRRGSIHSDSYPGTYYGRGGYGYGRPGYY
jgi:hypothetical protein